MTRLQTDKMGCRHKFEANFCGGGFIVEVGNLSLALILGTAAAVQDDDDDNFTTLIKDLT